jgi:hypothetical protein
MTITYDNRFDQNEVYILLMLISGIFPLIRTKKIFSREVSILYILYGIFMGLLMDHTISVKPLDFYDVNDNSKFNFMDFLTYVMYGPFTYFFIYMYQRLNIKAKYAPPYILLWTFLAMAAEYAGVRLGVYHYKNGYQIYYSLPIYLAVLTLQMALYRFITPARSRKP